MLIDNNVLPKVQGNNRPLKAFPKKFALVLVLPLSWQPTNQKGRGGSFRERTSKTFAGSQSRLDRRNDFEVRAGASVYEISKH